MNALAYTIIGILGCTIVSFGFLANKGIRNLEDHVDHDLEDLWLSLHGLRISLDQVIAKQNESTPTVTRNAARKVAPAVATGRSASKVEAKKAVKKAVAKKAPAKKAAAK